MKYIILILMVSLFSSCHGNRCEKIVENFKPDTAFNYIDDAESQGYDVTKAMEE